MGLSLAFVLPRTLRAQAPLDAGNERYEQTKLPNGLRVYLAEDHRLPLVGISIEYPVGQTLDPKDARGASLLVAELLPGLSTRHLPGGAGDLIEAAGFYPWEVKANTREEDTRLQMLVPAGAIDLALFLEAERMGFAAEGLSSAAILQAKQKLQKRAADTPLVQRSVSLVLAAAYGPQHPYAVVAAPPQLDKVDLDWLRHRLRCFYNVAGARLSIVGDFDSKRLMPVVQRTFGRLQGLPVVPLAQPPKVERRVPSLVGLRAAAAEPAVVWGWRSSRYLSAADITLDVVARYLKHRLSQRLGTSDKRAGVNARQVSLRQASLFFLHLPVPAGVERSAVEQVAREELDAIASGKVDADELELAKSTITTEIARNMDDLLGRGNYMFGYASFDGKLDGFAPHLTSYLSMTAAKLSDVVRRELRSPDAVLTITADAAAGKGVLTGNEPASVDAPNPVNGAEPLDGPDWYKPPNTLAFPRFDPPRLLELGEASARVLFMPRFGLPTINLRVALNWQGAAPIPAIRQLLLLNLLRARPGGRPILYDRIVDLGGRLSATQDEDSIVFSVVALAERADAVMAALRDTIEVARFDQAVFEKARLDLAVPKEPRQLTDWGRANRWFDQLSFPKSHRYHAEGVEDSERSVTLQAYGQRQLEAFWKSEQHAARVSIGIVGPVDEARVRALAAAGMPRFGSAKPAKVVNPPSRTPAQTFLVDAPSTNDVLVKFTWPVSAWGSAGYVDSLGLRWMFSRRAGGTLEQALRKHGVKTISDLYANTLARRDGTLVVFALRVPKEQLVGLFQAVAEHVAMLRRGEILWDGVQEARREAVQWVTERYEGADGCMQLLANHADFAVPSTASEDIFLLAQRIDRTSLSKAAAVLAPEKATVLAYGAVAGLKDELDKVGFPSARVVSLPSDGKVK